MQVAVVDEEAARLHRRRYESYLVALHRAAARPTPAHLQVQVGTLMAVMDNGGPPAEGTFDYEVAVGVAKVIIGWDERARMCLCEACLE